MVKRCLTLVFRNRPTNGYNGLLILAEIRRGELITQMAVTGTGTETSWTCKECANNLWIYPGL